MSGKNIGIGLGVLVVAGIISRMILPEIQFHVEVKAEEIFPIGGIPFTNSLLVTLIVDGLLVLLAFFATRDMHIVPRGLQNAMEWLIESLANLFEGINREYARKAFPILATIFLFVLLSNWLGLLPLFGSFGLCHTPEGGGHGSAETRLAVSTSADSLVPIVMTGEEIVESHYIGCDPGQTLVPILRSPSADLNVTLAITVWAVVMIEYFGLSALGTGYLTKFFNFKEGFIGFMVGLLEFISEIARIPAFMFRLFGNIFAGEVLLVVMIFLVPLGLPLPFYGFEVFVGFIQAFIFSVLTMAFISIAVTPHHADDHGDSHH